MKFNPDIHHRRSIRLPKYDYSTIGAYFVTVCTQNREILFGDIRNGEMALNEAGRMVADWWTKLPGKFQGISLDESIIMPNHFHGIVVINNADSVGADPCVCPDDAGSVGADPCVCPPLTVGEAAHMGAVTNEGAHMGAPLHRMVQWFKVMTTNAYIRCVKQSGWPPFPGRLWQRNYYERVIRDEKEMTVTREYIMSNPTRWSEDKENPDM